MAKWQLDPVVIQSKGIFLNVSLWHNSQRKNDGGLQWRYVCGSSRSPPPPSPPPSSPPSSSPPSPPPCSAPPARRLGGRGAPRAAACLLGRRGRRSRGRRRRDVEPRAAAAVLPIPGPGPGPRTGCSSPSSGTGCSSCCSQSAPSSALTTSTAATGHWAGQTHRIRSLWCCLVSRDKSEPIPPCHSLPDHNSSLFLSFESEYKRAAYYEFFCWFFSVLRKLLRLFALAGRGSQWWGATSD